MDAELLLWLRAAPWPLGSLFGSFHHAERAPRVTSSLTAESPTIRSFQTSLVSIQRFSPPVFCAQGRLVKDNVAFSDKLNSVLHTLSSVRHITQLRSQSR